MSMSQDSAERLEAVVIIHGLWMTGFESSLLRYRLASEHGYAVEIFHYDTLSAGLEENSARLEDFLATVPGRVLHLVGHSLGGVLALHTVMRGVPERPGRVVCLGSPLRGSQVAGGLARREFGAAILGQTARESLIADAFSEYRGKRQVGVIAGSLGLGLGQLIEPLPEPHDGTVAVVETQLPGITDHLILPVSHMGLLVSEQVAAQAAHFLRYGRFHRERPAP